MMLEARYPVDHHIEPERPHAALSRSSARMWRLASRISEPEKLKLIAIPKNQARSVEDQACLSKLR
jgi:hypothetical protein